jgi:hypothetical protein
MDRLHGVRLKIERAKKHIQVLDAEIGTFCNTQAYVLGVKEKPEIEYVTLYIAEIRPIPDEIPLILGDAVHNLRSALDHLIWQLVEAGGGTPNRDTYFPICQTPEKYTAAISKGKIKMMRPGAEKIICAVQPYTAGDNPLWYLHKLDIADKHRLLVTVTAFVRGWWADIGGMAIPFRQKPRPLKLGDEITNIPISTYERTGQEKFKLGVNITFGQSEIVAGKPVVETLNGMADFVHSIVTNFGPFLV